MVEEKWSGSIVSRTRYMFDIIETIDRTKYLFY